MNKKWLLLVLAVVLFTLVAFPQTSLALTPSPTPIPAGFPIPGQIEAESYSAMSGIQTQACSEGGLNVGWIDAGDWMDYQVNVLIAMSYKAEFRVAGVGSIGKFELRNGDIVLGSYTVPNTGGWQTWTTISSLNVLLKNGLQTLRVLATGGGWNFNWFSIHEVMVTPTPTPFAVPGQIEAENYSTMSGVGTENCSEGGKNVGWIDTGDWVDYAVNIPSSGFYRVDYRITSPNATGKVDFRVGETTFATTAIPNTGGWQSWKTVSADVNLNPGAQTIRLFASGGGWNINWFSLNRVTPTPTPTLYPTPSSPLLRAYLSPVYPPGTTEFHIYNPPLGNKVFVKVTDSFGNGLQGHIISWHGENLLTYGAYFENSTTTTDNFGGATNRILFPNYYMLKVHTAAIVNLESDGIYGHDTCTLFVYLDFPGPPPTVTPTPTPTPLPVITLLSQGKTATVSSYQAGNEVYKGNDGNTTTRWAASSGTFPQWWQVDLGAVKELRRVDTNWYSSINRAYKYKIEVSHDNVNFTPIVDLTGNTAYGNTSDGFIATGRYVRITVTGSTTGWASFYECGVYGY